MPDEDEESSRNTLLQTNWIYEKKEMQLSELLQTAVFKQDAVPHPHLRLQRFAQRSALVMAYHSAR